MNSYERVMTALSFKEPDRIPVYPILSGVTRNLTGVSYKEWSTDAGACADALLLAAEKYEQDCIVTLIDLSVECDAWGQEIIYPDHEAARPNYQNRIVRELSDYANIKKVDWSASSRMRMHVDVCRRLVEKVGGQKPVVAFVFGPLGVLSMLRGQQDMYMDLYDDPDAVKEAARQVNETLKDYVRALCLTGVDAVMLDTLFASASIMSKKMWLEMEGGIAGELADVIREEGKAVMVHNCGLKIYFDAQIETIKPCAISFLYPPDDCADFKECKEKYGKQVMLIGCVPPAMVVTATDEQWDATCKEQIDVLAPGGGFMLATGCEYPANSPFDKARRMVDIAKAYGRYKG